MLRKIIIIVISFILSFIPNDNKVVLETKKIDVEEKAIMQIEIPKLKLKNNIYDKNSKNNDIDKNVIIMKESDMPDIENSTLIIGAHSGIGKYAYFKDLNKLEVNDEIIVTYDNHRYIYKVAYKYLDPKDGSISISNNSKRILYLYTCNPNDKQNYLVIVCKQKEK